jgi:sugar/nucleoside kinase (ribokinase family)
MSKVPDVVLVGHLAQDVQPDHTFQLGGTVTYAGLLASHLGLKVGIVTSGTQRDVDQLRATIPDADVVSVMAPTPTIFENRYVGNLREQFLLARAAPITSASIPEAWRRAPLVLLGPIANEVDSGVAAAFRSSICAATPQGWLRGWDERGRVYYVPWTDADSILPYLSLLVLSTEDVAVAVGSEQADTALAKWAAQVPYLVVTDGPGDAEVWIDGTRASRVPAFVVEPVDPTGAGDTFTIAFLIALWRIRDPLQAARFAHAAASYIVRAPGLRGMPSANDIASLIGRTLW